MTVSPYAKHRPSQWPSITRKLVEVHPLNPDEIVEVVLLSWQSIFDSRFGTAGSRIGKDIFPKPQIMGFLLHELIPLELQSRHPQDWRGDEASGEKDLVCLIDERFSVEVKTSSNPSHIYGNRSYAQQTSSGKKGKTGYYLAVNFGKFAKGGSGTRQPSIRLIRFGWLDSSDWIGQVSPTGQQARLSPQVERGKLLQLYPAT